MQSREFAVAAGCALALAGGLLLGRIALGRALFLFAWPLAAVAAASNDPALLWQEDLPFTLFAAVLYAPYALFLSRPGAQLAFGRTTHGFVSRGGVTALAACLLYGGLYGWVASTEAGSGGPPWPGFGHIEAGGSGYAAYLGASGVYVAKKAVALVLFVHAAVALVAVSIPPGARAIASAAAGASRASIGLLWIASCVTGYLCTLFAWQVAEPSTVATIWLVAAGAGAILGTIQAAVPVRLCGIGPLRWILATAAGVVFGEFLIAVLLPVLGFESFDPRLRVALHSLGVGAVQAIGLRASPLSRCAWPLLLALAGAIAMHIGLTLVPERTEDLAAMHRRFLVASAYRGFFGAVFTMQLLWAAARPAPEAPSLPVASRRDTFAILGFQRFVLLLRLFFPLFLIGGTLWLVADPNLKLTDKGPLILAGLAAWTIWEFTRFVKWVRFTVAVTEEGIAIGGKRAAWADVATASVRTAFQFQTWIELRTTAGETLKIPAAVGGKDLLLTLVEKHHPAIVRK